MSSPAGSGFSIVNTSKSLTATSNAALPSAAPNTVPSTFFQLSFINFVTHVPAVDQNVLPAYYTVLVISFTTSPVKVSMSISTCKANTSVYNTATLAANAVAAVDAPAAHTSNAIS